MSHHSPSPGRHWALPALALTALMLAAAPGPLSAQSSSTQNTLNKLNSLLGGRLPQPGAPAQGGNVLQQMLAPAAAPQAAGAPDLFQLLSQSQAQIDEPREIEIGRQLAAVLLGSKPLHPDMA